nr:MAG TPA: hypothetical protein [Caudoviricetes sp.]
MLTLHKRLQITLWRKCDFAFWWIPEHDTVR